MSASLWPWRRLPPCLELLRPCLPLRFTAATTLLLLLLPAVILWRFPRPRAEGLGRLMAQAALLQSFPEAPSRPVPRLWQERFGAATAPRLWQEQRGLWWQFWGRQGDGPAYLVVPLPRSMRSGALPKPPHSAIVDDLLVVAGDPLSHGLLTDQLRLQHSRRRGLEQRCLERLQQEQAAFWTPVALGAMGGPVAPLLQGFQEGCVGLRLSGETLDLTGQAANGMQSLSPPPPLPAVPAAKAPNPATLLQLRGHQLGTILEGLLSRQLIRDPLAERYGVGPEQLALLRSTPFRLELRRQSSGPFQAALSLHLAPGAERRAWADLLLSLREPLEQQGLSDSDSRLEPHQGSQALPSSIWRREDDAVVGGWRWQSLDGAPPELLLFLGPVPSPQVSPGLPGPSAKAPTLQLEMQPRPMAELGLLPGALPAPLLQAERLSVVAQASSQGRSQVSALRGRLQLRSADRSGGTSP